VSQSVYSEWRTRFTRRVSERVALGLFVFAWIQSLHRYLTVEYGRASKHWDVLIVWQPLADTLLDGGQLYLGTAVDNKPPLFELLNVAVGATGHYYPVFLFLVGTANGLSAVLLVRFLRRQDMGREGIVTAVLFLAALPLIDGTIVNVRSFALVGVLAALWSRDPVLRGGAVAVAGMFSQYAFLAAPALVYDGVSPDGALPRRHWIARFAVALVAVVVSSFGVVAVLWGSEAAVAGIEQSFGNALEYTARDGIGVRSPLAAPVVWAGYLYNTGVRIAFVLIPAFAGVVTVADRTRRTRAWGPPQLLLALAVLFTLPLVVRALPFYWVLPLPFYAALAAVALAQWYRRAEPT